MRLFVAGFEPTQAIDACSGAQPNRFVVIRVSSCLSVLEQVLDVQFVGAEPSKNKERRGEEPESSERLHRCGGIDSLGGGVERFSRPQGLQVGFWSVSGIASPELKNLKHSHTLCHWSAGSRGQS